MPGTPVKFGDINKTAKDVIESDYHTSAYSVKHQVGTSAESGQFKGAALTTSVDMFGGEKACATPAKVTWKQPNFFGVKGLSLDKLEQASNGKYACEVSVADGVHQVKGLKVVAKSDLADMSKVSLTSTYTGLSETLITCEIPPMNAGKSSFELTRLFGAFTFGAKLGMANLQQPSLGLRYAQGPFFAALTANVKDSVDAKAHCYYKVSNELEVAAACDTKMAAEVGVKCKASDSIIAKAKVDSKNFSTTLKYTLAKGFNVFCGCKLDLKTQSTSYGANVSLD